MSKWSAITSEFKQEVADYYSTHTFSNTTKHFKMPEYVLHSIIEELNLPIRTRAETLRIAREQHYGSIDNYVRVMSENIRKTSLERYGVDNFSKTSEFIAKSKATYMKHYGVDNIMKSAAGKDAYTASHKEKYGVEWPMQSAEILEKREATNRERYGGSGWESDEITERYKQTIIDKYGVTNPAKSEEIKEKLSRTVQERYGVAWFCMHPKARGVSGNNSKPNIEFEELLKEHNIPYEREFPLGRYSYDFKIGNILIEVDPTPTHNSTWGRYGEEDKKDKLYHINKSRVAEDNGFRCIHVWDWDDPFKVISLLKHRQKLYARNFFVIEVSKKDAEGFLNKYHLQGDARDSIRLGLFNKDELVGLMTFGKPRYNSKYQYELVRFCCSHYIVGGAEKLYYNFTDKYNPDSVVSYCDNSKFLGNIYTQLGFTFVSRAPSKHWYNMSTSRHITDNLLRQRGFDQLFGTTYGKGTSNEKLMLQNHFVEVYDAGQSTYLWTRKL